MTTIQSIVLSAEQMASKLINLLQSNKQAAVFLSAAYASTDPNKVFENGTFKSTTVALGSNPAVGAKPLLVAPTITSGEIDVDGINNPYTLLNFQIDAATVLGNNVVAFKVYRQQVAAEDLAQEVENFTAADFDKLSSQTTMVGKFSADKKAAYTINQFKTSPVNQNTNLFTSQQTSNQQQLGANQGGYANPFTAQFSQNTVDATPKLVATINNAAYQASASLKQVYVQNANLVNLSYTDHNVTYGSGYIYSVSSLCATSEESRKSETLSMVVLNLNGINPPASCQVKQNGILTAQIAITCVPGDLVKYAYVFRRNIEDLTFHPFSKVANQNNYISVADTDLDYGNTYIYRVLLENIFGAVSEPTEVTFTCSGQKILGPSRSNNLSLPIILASQDQNSEGIKLTIFPNDQRVLYYSLDRRNLSAGETVFTVPTNKTNQFWPLNQFFVQPLSQSLLTSSSIDGIVSGSLPAQSNFIDFADPIVFVDEIVSPGSYYEYRTVGHDIYGNITGYGFAALRAENKNSLRSPVNFVAETLRETPFRIKLTWEDDNAASRAEINNQAQQKYLQLALQQADLSAQAQASVESMIGDQDLSKVDYSSVLGPFNLQQAQITAIQSQIAALANASNPLKFQLQRRLSSDSVYSSFPYTENNWVVDEVATSDAIPFQTQLVSGSPQPISSSAIPLSGNLSRSFGLPNFLQAQQVYQYRVAAMTLDGETSDFCNPITVIASAQISSLTNLSASILNPKVTPAVVRLQWGVDPLKNVPDHWRVERKVNSATDTYRVLGNSYLDTIYFDRSAQIGQQYMYRLRSVSATGDESDTQEIAVST